ncbi:hypothetical protein [Thiomicrospira sp. ALE5]|uniref:hypothetical protein n=1 Tax=Thiomicrospira sp. ALE5 TaxID=748650 RepID=UPI0008E2F345|nr:hypothetical protein [Thiomicrospira sp. ALE5]SFR59818.1 hypothetical protein SAMN03092900_1535 [Thiomicrospira sp. ALE5]
MARLKSMSVGFDNWQSEVLKGQFYPDDLPEEWCADYYFNYFRVAMATQGDWMKWDKAVLTMLDEAMFAENMLYLRWQAWCPDSARQFERLSDHLGDRLGVLLLEGWTQECFENHADLWESSPSNPTLLQPTDQSWVLSGWQWDYNNQRFSGQPLAILNDLPENIKQQRQLIDVLKASLPNTTAMPVFVDPSQVSVKQLTDLASLIELLGY